MGEFVQHDRFKGIDINSNQALERCFRSGQAIEISIIFTSSEQGSRCPTCGEISNKSDKEAE